MCYYECVIHAIVVALTELAVYSSHETYYAQGIGMSGLMTQLLNKGHLDLSRMLTINFAFVTSGLMFSIRLMTNYLFCNLLTVRDMHQWC